MKLTKLQLKEIIKEEIEAELAENENGLLARLMQKLEDLEQKVDDVLFGTKERPTQHTSDQDILDQEVEIYNDPNYVNPDER